MSSSSSPSNSVEKSPPWIELPREITYTILQKLGAIEILTSAQKVCTTWRSVCQDVSMWRTIDMRNTANLWEMPHDFEKICRNAVDRSRGQLIDINIEYFGTDDLLQYISQRCNQLRRLRLVYPYNVTSEGVTEAVKNLPLLEDLHLHYTGIGVEATRNIGSSCPLLKSFTLSTRWYRCLHVLCDTEAVAIAETMRGLRHLQLLGNRMTNVGLQAILDGCPNLESLDVRQCFNVHFGEDLEKLCSGRIKDLRRPYDSTYDYEFVDEICGNEASESDDDYITGFSDVDMVSDYEDYMEFSEASDDDEHDVYDDEQTYVD